MLIRGAVLVLLAVATISGCGTKETVEPAAPSGATADSLRTTSTKDNQATPAIEMRAGNHGSEDRFVLEFSGIQNIEVISHTLNEEPPVRGGSGEPITGMVGDTFLHVIVGKEVPLTTTAPTSVVKHDLPIIKSAIVNDIEGGTMEATVGLSGSVDYEVLVEGDKVIVNMAKGPLGR